MFIKMFLLSLALTALIMITLGIRLIFDKKAEFTVHSCTSGIGNGEGSESCHSCQLQDVADCSEKKNVSLNT